MTLHRDEGTGRLKSSRRHRRPMSELSERGARRIEWARDHMPVLASIRDSLKEKKTLRGLRFGMALHVEAKTGVLALSLQDAGAQKPLSLFNPPSTRCMETPAPSNVYVLAGYSEYGEPR